MFNGMPSTMLAPRESVTELGSVIAALARALARESVPINRTRLSVLATLTRGGPRRITELAQSEYVSQPAMTTLVARLEQEGWVERREDPRDGRVVNVAVTAAGREVVARAIAARDTVLGEWLEALPAARRRTLFAALPALRELLGERQ